MEPQDPKVELLSKGKNASVRLGKKVMGLGAFYKDQLTSRAYWVDFAAQSSFYNLYLASVEMFWTHPDPEKAVFGRCMGVTQGLLGICKLYSAGRKRFFKALGLNNPDTLRGRVAMTVADGAYSFAFNIPTLGLNYAVGGMPLMAVLPLAVKGAGALCWTGPVAGVFIDTFNAMDSDDPELKAKVLKPIRWALIDRFELKTRKKMIWGTLVASTAATAGVYAMGIANR